MSGVSVRVRTDVLASLGPVLQGGETIAGLVEALATCEAYARVHDTTGAPGIDCAMRGPVVPVLVDGGAEPLRDLAVTMRPEETLDGLVTALLIGEVRYRRTTLVPFVASASEPVMSGDDLEFERLLTNYSAEPMKESTMTTFTVPLAVREDVLHAFDANLLDGEDRDEALASLIGAEAECRAEGGYVACDGARDLCGFSMTSIDVELDVDTHEALTATLRPAEDAGALVTALMLESLLGRTRGPVRADRLLAVA